MRFIRENNPPQALIRCIALRRSTGQLLDYDDIGLVDVENKMLSVVSEIRKARILDQGGICAYTMMRIDEDSCHNEHLIPRSMSKTTGQLEQTLDYKNIVACYPKHEKNGSCGFGATARGTKDLALTPLDSNCEDRIRYDRTSGKALATNPQDTQVSKLLDEVLLLNHEALIARRLKAINEAGVGKNSSPSKQLSEKKARMLAKDIIEHKKGKNLAPYCIAIAHAAIAHADLIAKIRRRY